MATIFELIVRGEIPCHKVWEDDHHLAFLDINPRVEGHTLVIPKTCYDPITETPDEVVAHLMVVAKRIAAEKNRPAKGTKNKSDRRKET